MLARLRLNSSTIKLGTKQEFKQVTAHNPYALQYVVSRNRATAY